MNQLQQQQRRQQELMRQQQEQMRRQQEMMRRQQEMMRKQQEDMRRRQVEAGWHIQQARKQQQQQVKLPPQTAQHTIPQKSAQLKVFPTLPSTPSVMRSSPVAAQRTSQSSSRFGLGLRVLAIIVVLGLMVLIVFLAMNAW